MLYSAFKTFGRAPKFGHFEVFGVKFSAKKSIFQNCPIKRAKRASRQGNSEKFHSKNLKNDQIEVVGSKFLNAL